MASGGATGDEQVMKKKDGQAALWTAEGGKHMCMVLCLSAEVLRKVEGNNK